jgi:RNA polymerase sigma-70 factor (ECF subfamily)
MRRETSRSRAVLPFSLLDVLPGAPSSHTRLVARAGQPEARAPQAGEVMTEPAVIPSPSDAQDAQDAQEDAPKSVASVPSHPSTAEATVTSIDAKRVDESAILTKAATGDKVAFQRLYIRHRPDVARLVFRMLGARSDLDDVVQEVFFQVFRSLKDFRGQSKFSTWLHRVTVNVVLMHRRAARSRPVFAEEAVYDLTADQDRVPPDEDADRRERMRAFGRLLDRLAEKKRTVFILHELEGVPPTEIATIVGAPVLTIRTRLFYARRELETMLADEPALASLKASFGKASDEGSES